MQVSFVCTNNPERRTLCNWQRAYTLIESKFSCLSSTFQKKPCKRVSTHYQHPTSKEQENPKPNSPNTSVINPTPSATQLSPRRPMLRTRTRTRTRRSTTTTILPRSTRPSLRTRWTTATMLARPSPTAVIVASASIRRNTAPHALSPRTRAESIHHHVRLADGAAGSAAAEADVASCQPWTARRCESVFESGGEVPVWLDACLGSGRAVGRRELRRAWL
jgi:hypothetical protein